MDIGTGKPTISERAESPHHLYDIIDPDEDFGLASYKQLVYERIGEIVERGNIPLLVGGSGLYVWSTVENWTIPEVAPDVELRRNLETQGRAEGLGSLHDQLRRIDPVAAEKIPCTNVRRVIRALEVFRATGSPPSSFWLKGTPPFTPLIIGLDMKRPNLYEAINRRVNNMIILGLVEEVKKLLDLGYTTELPAMSGIGYREVVSYLRGELDLEEAIHRVKIQTHRFARRQYTWFKINNRRIEWFDAESNLEPVNQRIREFLITAGCTQGQ